MDRRDGKDLAQLLQELGKLEGLRWIRLLCKCGEGVSSLGLRVGGDAGRLKSLLQPSGARSMAERLACCGKPVLRSSPVPSLSSRADCYPSYFSEALIDEIASNPKVLRRSPCAALWCNKSSCRQLAAGGANPVLAHQPNNTPAQQSRQLATAHGPGPPPPPPPPPPPAPPPPRRLLPAPAPAAE